MKSQQINNADYKKKTGVERYLSTTSGSDVVERKMEGWLTSEVASFLWYTVGIFIFALIMGAFFVHDIANGGSLVSWLFGGAGADFNYKPNPNIHLELTEDVVSNYFAIAAALAIGVAGALVAIRISDNTKKLQEQANETDKYTATLQAQANELQKQANETAEATRILQIKANQAEASELYYEHYDRSVRVYKDFAIQLASIFKSAHEVLKAFENHVARDGFWANEQNSRHFTSRKNAEDKLSEITKERAVSVNGDKDFISSIQEYIDRVKGVISILSSINDDTVLQKQWDASYRTPVTGWFKKLGEGGFSLIPEDESVDIDYLNVISIKTFLEYYITRLDPESVAYRLRRNVEEKCHLIQFDDDEYGEPIKNGVPTLIERKPLDDFIWSVNHLGTNNFRYAEDIDGLGIAGTILKSEREFISQKWEELNDKVNVITKTRSFCEGRELFTNLLYSMPADDAVIKTVIMNYLRHLGYSVDLVQTEFGRPFRALDYFSSPDKSKIKLEKMVFEMRVGKSYKTIKTIS